MITTEIVLVASTFSGWTQVRRGERGPVVAVVSASKWQDDSYQTVVQKGDGCAEWRSYHPDGSLTTSRDLGPVDELTFVHLTDDARNPARYHDMSPDKLDEIALSGEPLDGRDGHSFWELPETSDYRIIAVATEGTGNSGWLRLAGKTRRGKRLVFQGKVASLVRQGCPENVARIAACRQYGFEVWPVVADLVPVARIAGIPAHSRRAFVEFVGYDIPRLSMPRIAAAVTIAEEVARG